MANRQYIGARYVPKFMGNYDDTQIYEALCVVDNGLGTSYISKVKTPAGTPLNNTKYWTIYGASSGAIINLQNEIDDINNTKLPAIESDIDDLEDEVNILSNKRYILLTDSYGERTNSSSVRLDNLILSMIGGSNNVSIQNNGAGFTFDNGVITFLDMLTNESANIPNHQTVTDIVVLGGANDYTSEQATIENHISAFCAYCATEYPNAKIKIGAISRSRTRANININYTRVLPAYRNCPKFGAVYLNNTEYIVHNSLYIESDNVHPNALGVDALSVGVAEAILNGTCEVNYEISPTYTAATTGDWSNYTRLAGPTFYQWISNGVCGMRCNPGGYASINYGGSGLTAQVDIDGFATPDESLLVGYAANHAMRYSIPIRVILYAGGTILDSTQGSMFLNENSALSMTFRTEGLNITGCTQIRFCVLGECTTVTQET